MAEIHLILGVTVLALAVVATLWGGASLALSRPSVGFWYLLRVMQVALVLQILLGGLLLATGKEALDGSHYMYGIGALVVSFFAEGMRASSAAREIPEGVDFESLDTSQQRTIALRIVRRETTIMTLGALLIVIFLFRAAQTSGHLF